MGIGALFGLYDWRFEVLGLVSHALHLQKHYNCGPHTISFPRLRPACGVKLDETYLVNDDEFKRLVAILRLSVPYTGLICTAREPPALRREIMAFGISQIDAGSRVEIGGYTEAGDAQVMEWEQFELGDIRPLDHVVRELLVDGYIPSFCTACYRLGRTGEHFMEFAIPGFIQNMCTPNALSTLTEYLIDYASPETRAAGEAAIRREIEKLPDGERKSQLSTVWTHHARTTSGTCISDYAELPLGNRPLGAPRRARRGAVGHPHVAGDGELPAGPSAGASRPGPCLWCGQTGRGTDQSRAGPLGRRQVLRHRSRLPGDDRRATRRAHVIVDALQGGAGTSTNMNVNEVLANRALQLLGRPLGDYQTVSPHDDLNLHQSTNDTYPTALRVAAIFALRELAGKAWSP